MSTNFTFISDGSSEGDAAVTAMQATCDQDYSTLKSIYGLGDPPNLPFTIHVDPTVGGAYHLSCDGTEIWTEPTDAPTLLVAEVDEVFQAMTGTWNCGLTNGEGHSRVLAEVIRPAQTLTALDGDVSGWWNNGNPQDFVNDNSQNDQNEQANACGSLFLYYLNSLGFNWIQITAAGGPSLGDTYTKLTGRGGLIGFSDIVAVLSKIQQPWADNPFPSSPTPTPSPLPVPQPSTDNWFVRLIKWLLSLLFGK